VEGGNEMRFKFESIAFLVILFMIPIVTADSIFLIGDGTIETLRWQYTHFEPESNLYNIEYAINVSAIQKMELTSISDDIVQIEYNVTYTLESAYQKVNETIYTSTDYGLQYYDQNANLLATGGTTYTGIQQIRKSDGLIILHERPEDAFKITIAAYFDEPTIFSQISMLPALDSKRAGSTTRIFIANSATLSVGDSFNHPDFDDYEITGSGEYQGFDTWVIEPEELVCEGCSISSYDRWQFEKNSGLFLERNCSVSMPNYCEYEMHTWRIQFADVIMNPPSNDNLLLFIGISGVGIVVVVIGVFIFKKRGHKDMVHL